jgi:thiol:disulfide interchange protein
MICLLPARSQDPFVVQPSLGMEGETWVLKVRFEVPPGHHLYSEHLAFLFSDRGRLEEFELPSPLTHYEQTLGQARLVYSHSFEAVHRFSGAQPEPILLTIHYQGCEGANCFMPRTRRWRVAAGTQAEEVDVKEVSEDMPLQGAWKRLVEEFAVVGKGGGVPSRTEWEVFLGKSFGKPLDDKVLESVARSRLYLALGGAFLALGLAMRRYAAMHRPVPMRLVRGTSVGLLVLACGLVVGFFHERWPNPGVYDSRPLSVRGEISPSTENPLAQALTLAQAKDRPLVLYVWSNWSESCRKASQSLGLEPLQGAVPPVFQNATVVRVEVEDLRASPVRELCGFFSIRNIPAYVVLKPKSQRLALSTPGAACDNSGATE